MGERGVLVAGDGDQAGRDAAVRAYGVLRMFTGKAAAVMLPAGEDPAQILAARGPAALVAALRDHVQPLARLVIDAHLDRWAAVLDAAGAQLGAMRSAAGLIARLMSPETAREIIEATGGKPIETWADDLRPVVGPRLPMIARLLTTDAACQIAQVADRLGFEYSEVTAEVTNALIRDADHPKRWTARDLRDDLDRDQVLRHGNAARLAMSGFPGTLPPATSTVVTAVPRPTGNRYRRTRLPTHP